MKLRIIIADDEYRICNMLTKLIDCEALDLEIIGMVYDGAALLEAIQSSRPDIVITDISMPKESGIDVIRKTVQMGLICKFIIISGFRQFDYAYTALKYDVSDYLLKPVDKDELNAALSKIAWQLRHTTDNLPSGSEQAVHQYFMRKVIKNLYATPQNLSEINATYQLNLQKGFFQFILVRLDNMGKSRSIPEDPGSLHREVENQIKQHLKPHCMELVCTKEWDDILAILNYRELDQAAIYAQFKELFAVVKRNVQMFGGVTATLCIGNPYPDINKIYNSKTEATDAAWMRMANRIGSIVYFEHHHHENLPSLDHILPSLMSRIQKAFETLNTKDYTACIDELFTLPTQVVSRSEVKKFVRSIPELFFDLYENTLSELTNLEQTAKEIRYELRMVTSYSSCRSTLIKLITKQMDEIRDFLYQRNTKPIRMAIDYVKSNYSKPITLEDVAQEVKLSAVYFSSIFKKETNQNFSDFLLEYRMNIAKNLLKSSNLSIKEIAAEVSFSEARYFSKVFKKAIGIKPTDYKKIYN